MAGIVLAAGLACGGALGFAMGAKPALLARAHRFIHARIRKMGGAAPRAVEASRASRESHSHTHSHTDHVHSDHVHGGNEHLLGGNEHAGHAHPAYQDLEGQDAQDLIDYLYPIAVAFFAGFVLSTLVPDALTHSRSSLACFAAGAAVMGFLSKKVFKRDPCCEGGHDQRGFGAVSLLAMSVCSVNDGLLLGLLSPAWWSGLNVGMFIHKITSSFAIAQVLKQTRFRGAALYAFGAFSVGISPLAFLGARGELVRALPQAELVLAFSAGVLAWVALGSLLPHARAIMRRRPRTAIGFAMALTVSVGLGFWHTAMHHRFDSDPGLTGERLP
jgi:zinc transporter ZupT